MTNLTNSNERLLHLRARKQAIRDLVAHVTSAFGVQGAHDLLLEAATDIEEMIESGAGASKPVAAPSSPPAAAPAAEAAPKTTAPAAKRARAKAAPVAASRAGAAGGGGGRQKRPIASLLLGVLKDAAPKPLAGVEIFDKLNKVRPNTKVGQVFKTLTRLAGLPGTTLVRKGVEGKFRYTVRVAGDSPAPTSAKATGAKRAPAKDVRATKGQAEPAPAKTNNALVLEALAKVGPTTDAAPLAQAAFGVVTADTKRKVRNALNSLLSGRKIHRREDKTWEPLSA